MIPLGFHGIGTREYGAGGDTMDWFITLFYDDPAPIPQMTLRDILDKLDECLDEETRRRKKLTIEVCELIIES